MKVGEIMTRFVEFVPADVTVCEAAELMGELDVGGLPVGDADDLQGVLTDRDILFRVVAKAHDPAALLVREVASKPVIGCSAEDSLQGAMDLMATHGIRRLVVRSVHGSVIGWITLADLARHLLVGDEALQRALAAIGESGGA